MRKIKNRRLAVFRDEDPDAAFATSTRPPGADGRRFGPRDVEFWADVDWSGGDPEADT